MSCAFHPGDRAFGCGACDSNAKRDAKREDCGEPFVKGPCAEPRGHQGPHYTEGRRYVWMAPVKP